ncbi:MAG: HEAT repeat domain-containing protein, partial [Aggregatilineales bacterium]
MSETENADSFAEDAGIRLDTPDPPASLSYNDFEDYRNRELLKINGVSLTESAVTAALGHPIGVIQSAAAHTIGSAPYPGSVQALKKRLTTSDDIVKVETAYALARLQVPEGIAALKEILSVPVNVSVSPPIAAGFLARLGDPQGFPVLAKCFATDLEVVRMVACKQIFFFVPFQGKKLPTGEQVD